MCNYCLREFLLPRNKLIIRGHNNNGQYCCRDCYDRYYKLYPKSGQIAWNKGKKFPQFSGKNASFYGKKHTKESKAKMSKNHWDISGNNNPMKRPEVAKKISIQKQGSKNPQWRGGISFEPYSTKWTKTLKRSIRERDNYICQLCNTPQTDRQHAIHHIDYDKKNCNPDNLITLCISCHGNTQQNRKYWTKILEVK